MKCPQKAHGLNAWSPAGGAVWWGGRNFGTWNLAGGSQSMKGVYCGGQFLFLFRTLLLPWCSFSPQTYNQQSQGLWTEISKIPPFRLFYSNIYHNGIKVTNTTNLIKTWGTWGLSRWHNGKKAQICSQNGIWNIFAI
jgi:hypothetical protein